MLVHARFASSAPFPSVWFDVHHFQSSFYKQLERRRYKPGTIPSTQDVLHTWKLRALKIYLFKGSREAERALHAVAGAVPALARWMEQHMGDDDEET